MTDEPPYARYLEFGRRPRPSQDDGVAVKFFDVDGERLYPSIYRRDGELRSVPGGTINLTTTRKGHEAMLAMIARAFEPTGRTWPRWWCWLCGHTPTEEDSFVRNTQRCRCGTVRDVAGELVADRCPRWWLSLVGR